MNDDQKSFIIDLLKSEGWRIIKEMNAKQVAELRALATQQNISLEDRLWYSAEAKGREQAFLEVLGLIENAVN